MVAVSGLAQRPQGYCQDRGTGKPVFMGFDDADHISDGASIVLKHSRRRRIMATFRSRLPATSLANTAAI